MFSEETEKYLEETYSSKIASGSSRWSPSKWVSILSIKGYIEFDKSKRYMFWYKQVGKELDRLKKTYN